MRMARQNRRGSDGKNHIMGFAEDGKLAIAAAYEMIPSHTVDGEVSDGSVTIDQGGMVGWKGICKTRRAIGSETRGGMPGHGAMVVKAQRWFGSWGSDASHSVTAG